MAKDLGLWGYEENGHLIPYLLLAWRSIGLAHRATPLLDFASGHETVYTETTCERLWIVVIVSIPFQCPVVVFNQCAFCLE